LEIAGESYWIGQFLIFFISKIMLLLKSVIGNTAPRQKEEDRMEKWKILKSPRPKKPAVHGGLRKNVI
jgi:hypothetical protein